MYPGCELLLGVVQSPHTLKVTFSPPKSEPLPSKGGPLGSLGGVSASSLTLTTTAAATILPAPVRVLWQRPKSLRMDEALQTTHLQARLVAVTGDHPHPPRGLYDEMLSYYTLRTVTRSR